jgi:endonuclease YncB( thermonuclease family)
MLEAQFKLREGVVLGRNKAKTLYVVDGDTFDFMIDLGFDVFVKRRCRLYGRNAPDKQDNPEGYLKAKNRVKELIDQKDIVILDCERKEKWGRNIVKVITPDGQDLGDLLLNEQLVCEYYGQ